MRTWVVIFMGPQRIHRVPMNQASLTMPGELKTKKGLFILNPTSATGASQGFTDVIWVGYWSGEG